jgi:hypothetical protein
VDGRCQIGVEKDYSVFRSSFVGEKGECMPIERPSEKSLPEPIVNRNEIPTVGEKKALEQKVEKAVEKPLGVLPEALLPLLTQREITVLSVPFPKDLSPKNVSAVLTSIMEEKGISTSAGIGIETVAARRFNEEINALLEVGGYPLLCPEFDVQSVHGDTFTKVDIIWTEAGITITGFEPEQLSAFLEDLSKVNSDLHEQVTTFVHDGKVAVVSKEMVDGIEQIADDRFSEIATELRDRMFKTKESFVARESAEAEESSVIDELEEASEEGSKVNESETFSTQEAEIEDLEESGEGAATEEETEEHHPAVPISRNSVEAALIDKVAERILQRFFVSGIRNAQKMAERRIEEARTKEKLERDEVQKEQLKKKEKQKDIKAEAEKHYDEEREVEKSEQQRSMLTERGVSREMGKLEEHHEISEYQEKKNAGEPTPPPSVPRI